MTQTSLTLTYDIPLPESVADILGGDYWVFTGLKAPMLAGVSGPMKFSAAVSVFVASGFAVMELNLRRHPVVGPCIVNIRAGEIVQLLEVSEDFEASFLVMSKSFVRSIFMYINDVRTIAAINGVPLVRLAPESVEKYRKFYADLRDVATEPPYPGRDNAVLFSLLAFFFRTASHTYDERFKRIDSGGARLSDRFLMLVEEHFRQQRFLDFYAHELGVSAKHLSRTIKTQTGQTAGEWIEQFVILEAKVLLKSSNLNVQQISEQLHFPSQSLFGKYFKKCTGLSPRDYRNLH